MTEQEAIKELQENIDLAFGSSVSNESSELAIKALEKQIAKKPIQQSTDEKTHYKCVCGHLMLTRYHADGLLIGSRTFHCSKCGQKLDWE